MALSVVQVIGNVAVGGAERHLLGLVRRLRERQITQRVICPRPGPLPQALTSEGVPVEYLEMVHPRPGDEFALDWTAVVQLGHWFSAWRPDIVHTHLYPAHLHAALAAVRTGVPVLVHTAHTLIVRPGDVLLSRLTHARTIATSNAVAELLVHAGVDPERIEVIYNGVGAEHFGVDSRAVQRARAELGLGVGRRPSVGMVARLSPEKGVDVLLRALAQVVERGFLLDAVIIGDGPLAPTLRQLTAELGLASVVRFLGTRDDVAVLNRALDIFVLSSREEACPMALLEAMAAARGVVATAVGGSSEIVTDEVDGLLVPVDDPDALAGALVRLLSSEELRQELGRAAQLEIAERFGEERMIDQTVACYRRLAGQTQ